MMMLMRMMTMMMTTYYSFYYCFASDDDHDHDDEDLIEGKLRSFLLLLFFSSRPSLEQPKELLQPPYPGCNTGVCQFIIVWQYMGGPPKIMVPPKWMVKIIVPNPIKMDDLGVITPIFGNIHISYFFVLFPQNLVWNG